LFFQRGRERKKNPVLKSAIWKKGEETKKEGQARETEMKGKNYEKPQFPKRGSIDRAKSKLGKKKNTESGLWGEGGGHSPKQEKKFSVTENRKEKKKGTEKPRAPREKKKGEGKRKGKKTPFPKKKRSIFKHTNIKRKMGKKKRLWGEPPSSKKREKKKILPLFKNGGEKKFFVPRKKEAGGKGRQVFGKKEGEMFFS